MEALKITLIIVQIIVTLLLIVIVLLQDGNSYGLSGSISGGAETFFGKSKGRTFSAILRRLTKYVAILFIVLSLVLTFLCK